MNPRNVVLGSVMGVLTTCSLLAQSAPVLGSLEAPYPAVQSTVHVAGTAYGPGAVAYGPVGTPLELAGSNMDASGTVQFIGYKNGVVDPNTTVQATVTFWSPTLIFLTVPSGAVTGLVKVTTAEGKTSVNGMPFIVMPGAYAGSCPAVPPNNQLQITTSSLHDGMTNQSYNATLVASGGSTAYTWSVTNGSLPSGLSLGASTGTISGTPSGPVGPIDITFQVVDSSSPQKTDQAVLSLTIQASAMTPRQVYSYAVSSYDGAGNILQSQDSIMGNWGYTYDSLNRLITGTPSTGAYSGQYACWSYDPFGNRTAQSLQTTACVTPVPATVSYNSSNQVTWVQNSAPNGFVYDAAGEVTADSMNQYTYDAEGRICAVTNTPIAGDSTMTGYLYDTDGNRVAKGTITTMSCDPGTNGFRLTESYVLGLSGEELTVLDGNNNWQRTNVYASGKLLATYDQISDPSSGSPSQIAALHFHLTDPLGTRRMQLSGEIAILGCPETDIQSLPFGDQLSPYTDQFACPTADDATSLHFTGKERDTESGNDYFGARYYASTMGRFLSPDWSAKEEPVPYAKLDNPQTLNLYNYMRNNPLAGVDPDGHCCDGDPPEEEPREESNFEDTAKEMRELSSRQDAIEANHREQQSFENTQKSEANGYDDASGVSHAGPPTREEFEKAQAQNREKLEKGEVGGALGAKENEAAGKGVQGGPKDRSGQGTIDQLKGVQGAQKSITKKRGYRIRTTKSEQDVDNANKKHATNLKDAQKHYDE